MRRQSLRWLLFVPLTALGGLLAHVAVQALAVHPHESAHSTAGHIDIGHWPACAAICGAIGFAALALAAARGGPARVPLWLFALVPPAGFVVQEEAFALSGGLAAPPLGLELLAGLALQIPFALAAFFLARAVVGVALKVVRYLRGRPGAILRAPIVLREPLLALWPTPPAFVLGYGQRGPPA